MSDNWLYKLVGITRGKYFLPKADDVLRKDNRPPVIYLRSFADELSEYSPRKFLQAGAEDHRILAQFMKLIGPYIAIGRPGEPFPELGAARMYIPEHEWQHVVGNLIDVAAAFVFQGSPSSAGLAWELSELVRRTTPSKILLILPKAKKEYHEFRLWATRILPKPLPTAIPNESTNFNRRFMAFYSDWEPYSLAFNGMPWTLRPFFRQNGFPFPQKSGAEAKTDKLLARVKASNTGALAAYRANLASVEQSAALTPKNAGWQREIAVAHDSLGDVLRAQGDLSGAHEAYQASLTIMERLSAQDPKNAAWQREFAIASRKIREMSTSASRR
jgi:hypothetical protein